MMPTGNTSNRRRGRPRKTPAATKYTRPRKNKKLEAKSTSINPDKQLPFKKRKSVRSLFYDATNAPVTSSSSHDAVNTLPDQPFVPYCPLPSLPVQEGQALPPPSLSTDQAGQALPPPSLSTDPYTSKSTYTPSSSVASSHPYMLPNTPSTSSGNYSDPRNNGREKTPNTQRRKLNRSAFAWHQHGQH